MKKKVFTMIVLIIAGVIELQAQSIVTRIARKTRKATVDAVKVMGIKAEGSQKIWYGRGYGAVKTETYEKKGKIMTTNVLVEID